MIVCAMLFSALPEIHAQESTTEELSTPYPEQKKAIGTAVEALARTFASMTEAERDSALREYSGRLTSTIVDNLIPYWYGTPWAFYGTTQIPRDGSIACGYFVSTLLRDAGVNVERVRMAQQASELIIKSLTTETYIERFRNTSIEHFVDKLIARGDGLYVVGLDIHTGFILVRGSSVDFIHSSYVKPFCVVREKAVESKILIASRYRVVGHISADPVLLRKWLNQTPIKTVLQ